jgi:CheY-like chemotaxis protein
VRGETIQRRVLVIEDDDAVRTMLLTVLEVADYEVRGVRSGADALGLLNEWRPDVIALDILTPDMDGYRFLAEQSRRGDIATIPVVVVTFSTVSLPTAMQLGVRAVLQQPHDVDYLRSLIADAIVNPDSRCCPGEPLH